MRKVYLFAAVAALTLASCSSKDEVALESPNNSQQAQLEAGQVGFDAYTQRGITRGGDAGVLTTNTDNTVKLTEKGFGVFGYYTDNNDYDQRSTPNFFYNQKVTYQTDKWAYEPVKYWPNEYGDNAISDDADKVTYFAYAPFVEVVPSSGKLAGDNPDKVKLAEQWGITGMTKNTAQGDPMVKYIASFNSNHSVDLAWGTVADECANTWKKVNDGKVQSLTAGDPWFNIQRPEQIEQRVKFQFYHALAQMQIKIDADADVYDHSETDGIAQKTKVWVRSVTFKGFALKGTLNLNNEEVDPRKPYWLDYNGQNELVAEEITVYDQRKDGKEGVAGASASGEKLGGLNPALVQDSVYLDATNKSVVEAGFTNFYGSTDYSVKTVYSGTDFVNTRTGVTNSSVNLFDDRKFDADGKYLSTTGSGIFHVIPVDEDFEVEIVYDIETVDQNLAQNLSDGQTKGSSIENRIRKTISFGGVSKLQAGHSYKLNLHLGMNSVKFDAAVTDWIEEPAQDVDLPANFPVYDWKNAGPFEITIPYFGDYDFAFKGMNGGTSISNTDKKYTQTSAGAAETETASTFLTGWTTTTNNARADGVALQKVTTAPNPNTVDRIQEIEYQDNTDATKRTIKITQAAHPLFMQITTATKETQKITLTRYNNALHSSSDNWTQNYGWICDGTGAKIDATAAAVAADFGEGVSATNYVRVWRNGTRLTWVTSIPVSGAMSVFTFKNEGTTVSTAEIEIGDMLKPGDVIKVTIKTGDAPEETVTYTVQD